MKGCRVRTEKVLSEFKFESKRVFATVVRGTAQIHCDFANVIGDPLVGKCWEQHVIPQQSSSTSNAMALFAALLELMLAGRQTWFDSSALGRHNIT